MPRNGNPTEHDHPADLAGEAQYCICDVQEKRSARTEPVDIEEIPGGAARVFGSINRRRMLFGGGAMSLAGLLAACGGNNATDSAASSSATSSTTLSNRSALTATNETPVAPADDQSLRTLLAGAPSCPATSEETEGPYWFDVNYIRSDIREAKPGVPLELMLRVVDLAGCTPDGGVTPVKDAVVEIWHCDAKGIYSGFEDRSRFPYPGPGSEPPAGGQPPAPGAKITENEEGKTLSSGSYSAGDPQSQRTDGGSYLRGAQVTDREGIVRFTSIYPGWYFKRTVHIHARVHINKALVLTSQLYFDDALNDSVFATVSPYTEHPNRDTRNATDLFYDPSGLMAVEPQPSVVQPTKVLAALNIGVHLS